MADDMTAPSIFERHLQTGIQLLLVGLLGWAGLKLVELSENSARLQERLTYQGQQISSLSRDIRDWSDTYYLKTSAEREIGALKAGLSNLSDRVTVLERKNR